jgi:hypothetical protein
VSNILTGGPAPEFFEMNTPWQYTSLLDAADHWQALIAGGLGFIAAIFVVWLTLSAEKRQRDAELDGLRKSLAVELRIMIPQALGAHDLLRSAVTEGSPVTARMVEHYSYVQPATVYPAVAQRVGLLGTDAMQIVIVYSLIEVARSAAARLIRSREPTLDPAVIAGLAHTFLVPCTRSLSLLTSLQTGTPEHEQSDAQLIRRIQQATLQASNTPVPAEKS